MVGCTDYSEDIQNLGTEVDNKIESLENELDALKKSVAETYATIEDLNDLADEVDAVNNAVDALEATVAEKADKADVEAKINDVNAAIEDLKAKLDTKADKTALEAVEARVTALENEVKALDAEKADITYVDGQVAALETLVESYKTQLDGKISDLTAELEKEVAALEAEDKELQDQIDELKADVTDLKAAVEKKADKEYVDEEFVKIATQLSELAAADGRLQDQINTIITDLGKLTDRVTELETLYIALKKSTEEQIKALEDKKADKTYVDGKDKELQDKIDALKESLDKLEKKYEDALKQIEELYTNKVDKAIFDATITNFTDELSKVAALASQIPELLARVQSLVYVPDYSDHKATIQWAKITNGIQALNIEEAPAYTVLAKASELKYLVKANTPADAKSAAGAIVAAWEEVLDYLVEPVEIRTRSEEAVADLEIVGVTAKDDVVTVSVVAKNFDYKFFDNKEEGIYSAAIVLKDDKGNNLTSEYTNLVPGVAEEYQMALFVPVDDDPETDATLKMVGNDEVITYYIPCNDTEMVKSAVKPTVGFIPVGMEPTNPVSFLSVENLKGNGYDVAVDMDITLVDTENKYVHDGTMDTKPGPIYIDNYFNIEGGNPVYDFHYSVKPDVAFENVGKFSTVTYTFTCGNTVQNLTYRIELDNAQVEVNIGKYDEETMTYETVENWTLAKCIDLMTPNVGYYTENLVIENVPYYGPINNLAAVLQPASGAEKVTKVVYVKNEAGEYEPINSNNIQVGSYTVKDGENPGTLTITLLGGTYSWNNEYKVVWTSENNEENVDVTTTAIIKLANKPASIPVPVEVTYTLNGEDTFFSAKIDLADEAYDDFKPYLGFANDTADETEYANRVTKAITAALSNIQNTNKPVVNNVEGVIPNLWQGTQARLYANQLQEDNETTWTWDNWWDVPFEFTVTGKYTKPANLLIPSVDYVEEDDEVLVKGIFNEKGEYVLDTQDLGKYFDVNTPINNNLTVEFTITDEKIAELVTITKKEDGSVNNVTNVLEDGHLVRDLAVLSWGEFKGLRVPVKATLKANGFELDTYDVVLYAEDPLAFSAADVLVDRIAGYDATGKVFSQFIVGSTVQNGNLIDQKALNLETVFAESLADTKYGADIDIKLGKNGVYYYKTDEDEAADVKSAYSAQKYDISQLENGIVTLYADQGFLRKRVYVDVDVTFTHKFCAEGHTQNVTIIFEQKDNPIMNAFANGGEVVLESDLVLAQPIVLENDVQVVLNLNGHTIQNVGTVGDQVALRVNKGTLIIRGEGTVDGGNGANSNLAVRVAGDGRIYIEGGTYKVGGENSTIYASGNGKIYISGGEFYGGEVHGYGAGDQRWVLNYKDADRETALIEVTGGKFYDFNPANNVSEGANTNFVKDGYKAQLLQYSETDYEVVAE